MFSLAASGGDEVEGILEAEFGTGDVADFDTSDLTPLPNPVPLGDERSNPRIKSSRGAEVAMVSGELAAQPRPASDMDGDVVPLSSRQGDRQNGAGGRAPTARPVVSPVGSPGGTGSLRSVELDQELSAAAEVVDRPPRSAIAVPLLASAEGPAGKLGRARRSPDCSAEVGPPADDIDTAPVRRPLTRVSAMLRAASGHSLARTVTATIGAAVLVGACFGLLFWWFGARNDSSSADVEAGAQVASREAAEASPIAPARQPPPGSPATAEDTGRTPIASGAGDFAHAKAASVPSSAPVQPTSAPARAPQPSAASGGDGDQSPPSAALPVAAGSASYDDLYEEAKRARRRRDYHAVLSLTERALAHQETAQALTLQAEAMTALGESRRALPIADRATELRPRFSSGWYIKGRIHRTLGETDAARAAFERYLELDPEGTPGRPGDRPPTRHASRSSGSIPPLAPRPSVGHGPAASCWSSDSRARATRPRPRLSTAAAARSATWSRRRSRCTRATAAWCRSWPRARTSPTWCRWSSRRSPEAGVRLDDIGGVAVTQGPGLIGALLVAVQMGKAIAYARGLPLIGVHHLEGHLCAGLPRAGAAAAAAPGAGRLGRAHLAHPGRRGRALTELGATRDDAAGEAFDKVAKLLGLGYPGGVAIDRLARTGDPTAVVTASGPLLRGRIQKDLETGVGNDDGANVAANHHHRAFRGDPSLQRQQRGAHLAGAPAPARRCARPRDRAPPR